MGREGQTSCPAGSRNHLSDVRFRHRASALRNEHVGRVRVFATKLSQRSYLGAADRMVGRATVLRAGDVQQPLLEVDLVPAEGDELADAKAMPVGDEDVVSQHLEQNATYPHVFAQLSD